MQNNKLIKASIKSKKKINIFLSNQSADLLILCFHKHNFPITDFLKELGTAHVLSPTLS